MDLHLRGKTALVTGAARGIGTLMGVTSAGAWLGSALLYRSYKLYREGKRKREGQSGMES